MPGRIRIGISGWNYKTWRGVFYPAKLPHRRELAFAASHFPSIEINGTFYSLQRPSSFARWAEETPEDFVFAIKGSRYITHMLKLRRIEQPLANLFASGLLRLGNKLGPIVWQFPPNFTFRADVLESFLQILPFTLGQASLLAARHDERLNNRSWIEVEKPKQKLRHAIEIRHSSFVCPEFIKLLRAYNVALVCADTVEWPLLMDVTADFVYCRLHGSEVLYTSGYESDALDIWARRIATWADGQNVDDGVHASAQRAKKARMRDVYVYFDNDAQVRAPIDALALAAKLALTRA